MTGVANVTSEVAFDALQAQFIERLHAPKCTQHLKSVWQNVCICKAAIEITMGNKQKLVDLQKDIYKKYKKWVSLLLEPGMLAIGDLPGYVTENMMLSCDVGEKKFYIQPKAGVTLWKKWLKLRKEILNRDNHAIKKAIAKMPGCALPSGTDFSVFLDRVVYELFLAKEGTKVGSEGNDNKDEDVEGSEGSGDKDDDVEESVEDAGDSSDSIDNLSENANQNMIEEVSEKEGEVIDKCNGGEVDEDHLEPKAPKSFIPTNLLAILIVGVLSKECEPCINYVGEMEDEKKTAKIPTRNDIRLAGLNDGLSTPLKVTDSTRPDGLTRLKHHADYNVVYKEAAQAKDELGRKRLKMDEELSKAQMATMKQEATAREKEVAAREKEVETRAKETQAVLLEKMYRDLRDEFKDAKQDNDEEEVRRIKEELAHIKKLRIELVSNSNT